MNKWAYYNENDPRAAAWIRELMKAKLITEGEVDERSICDVQPDDLTIFQRCHFFAGVAVWDYALRQAGWPDERPVWTGSCPCQPFSNAGQGKGAADERHLWPAWYWLIGQSKPDVIFGEQTASKIGRAWLDVVCSDLEEAGFTVGACDIPACGFGAPHIRQRFYFVADAQNTNGRSGKCREEAGTRKNGERGRRSSGGGETGVMGESKRMRLDAGITGNQSGQTRSRGASGAKSDRPGESCELGNTEGRGLGMCRSAQGDAGRPAQPDSIGVVEHTVESGISGRDQSRLGITRQEIREHQDRQSPAIELGNGSENAGKLANSISERGRSGNGQRQDATDANPSGERCACNGFWADAEWLYCKDGKMRPTQSGLFVLAHGVACRVGLLRGFGNAIVEPCAQAFIEAYLQTEATATGIE